MGLLDNPAIQKMMMQMLQQAAPDLKEHIDSFTGLVGHFKAQLDAIEARLIRIENHLTPGAASNGIGPSAESIGSRQDNRGTS